MIVTILQLKVGQVAKVKKFHDLEATCKLISLGLVPNVRVEVIRKAPFGGALFVKIDHQYLAMRESEAASVEIEVL